jgi:hypothetical protein
LAYPTKPGAYIPATEVLIAGFTLSGNPATIGPWAMRAMDIIFGLPPVQTRPRAEVTSR